MILVTGGTGLLGSHLLLELVREHEEVVAVKRPSSDLDGVKKVFAFHSGEAEELFRRIDWVDIDLANYAEAERVLIDVDQVYHCAAMVSFRKRDVAGMIRFNTESTANLVDACLAVGVDRFLHVSSTSAIGRAAPGHPCDETMIWAKSKSNTAYSVSKFKSEMEVWRGIEEGLKAVIVNPAIILGPGFWDRGSSAMFRKVDRGLRYSTSGMTGYVGVEDVVAVMTRLMASDISGERYILSSGDYTFAEVMEMIAAAFGKPRKMKILPPRTLLRLARLDAAREFFTGRRLLTREQALAAFHRSTFSSAKIREAIGFQFTPIEEVIRHVAALYREEYP
jgi:dihydroflavonol-4-reductase